MATSPRPPVWEESAAVGTGQTCAPITESIGSITESEQRPKPERSCIATTLAGRFSDVFNFFIISLSLIIISCLCQAMVNFQLCFNII